jgi:hypothetical protein
LGPFRVSAVGQGIGLAHGQPKAEASNHELAQPVSWPSPLGEGVLGKCEGIDHSTNSNKCTRYLPWGNPHGVYL